MELEEARLQKRASNLSTNGQAKLPSGKADKHKHKINMESVNLILSRPDDGRFASFAFLL